jgi:heme/copper-type cytochrome/quinol oxidase subunit 2
MSATRRAALIAAAVVVVIVAFIALKPGSSSKKQAAGGNTPTTVTTKNGKAVTATPAIPVVQVKGAKPVGGIKVLKFAKGDTVQFKVVSDVADEVHVHGYDFHKNVAPGHPITFRFPAKIDGDFVVELEKRAEQIASLQVSP